MGQYWLIVNHSKKEVLSDSIGGGRKFREMTDSSNDKLAALAYLLADPSSMGQGGGDLLGSGPLCGSWIGDKIEIVGDYSENKPGEQSNSYNLAEMSYKDIYLDVVNEVNSLCHKGDHMFTVYGSGE